MDEYKRKEFGFKSNNKEAANININRNELEYYKLINYKNLLIKTQKTFIYKD